MTGQWDNLEADLVSQEGLRLVAYLDTNGVWTIGFGHTGPEVHGGMRWSIDKAREVFHADMDRAIAELDRVLPWWRILNQPRMDVLANMMFNLGPRRLLNFTHTLNAVQRGQWQLAHDEMLASKWARQVKGRAVRLAEQMLTGERNDD